MTTKATNTNRRTTLILIATTVLALLVYGIFFLQKLEVVVFNKTNYDIDSLRIGNQFVSIKKGDSVVVDNCNTISMQGYLPFGLVRAKISRKNKADSSWFICGTGVKEVRSGKYKFDIKITEDSSSYLLFWQQHNGASTAPVPW